MSYFTPQMVIEIRREMDRVDPAAWVPRIRLGDLLMTILAAIPYIIGWLIGFVWWLILLFVAAIVAGFKAGWGNK